MEMEDTVEMVESVLVKLKGTGSGDSEGVTTVVEDGTCNEGRKLQEEGMEMTQRLTIRIQWLSASET
jgi:hypothetical protein